MRPHVFKLLLMLLLGSDPSECLTPVDQQDNVSPPSVRLTNGTFVGVRNKHYAQDFFLGIPYAQPPIGSLRYAPPQPLNESFEEPVSATEYGWMCIGYGSDTSNLGNPVSEDCLTINIVRPAGTKPGDDLPVGLWIHGGSYVNGGSRDPRYNLSYIVDQSVQENKPIIAASINYRLSYWGFLFSRELQDSKAGNIGFKDQRLALRWIQENIFPFGGSADKVTVWGESAGARSIGMQLIAYDGKHDNLFRSAILESGSPVARFVNADAWQPYFNALLRKTGCADGGSAARISCLQALPWQTLNGIFNGSNPLGVTAPGISAVVDGDFITAQASTLLRQGKFASVPLLLGNNFDEGTAYSKQGINTTEEFETWLASSFKVNTIQIDAISELYVDDPNVGIPAPYPGRPSGELAPFGSQWKRVAAVAGDYQQHSGRRLLARSYAGAGLPVYSYMWDVYVNGIEPIYGATHFQEVAFVFNNVRGLGYATNPFEGKPQPYIELAGLMSSMWVAFIHNNDPNVFDDQRMNGATWPLYTPGQPHNLVFDANYTTLRYLARDDYREAQITYMQESVF
ncbi:carboxylesterase [Colletotrichum graminicola M1.001]|uniref:Carboxylic ester hydrolase n=1 Tax=Colletotrichum graminicola (strain M1.001 / M2 / FGSC 10212) TaxID=645133 RepID=E3QKN0_COLGM|nr:carboxylesterase [Colletotrichum graminicola M1.001]EFQ31418.1 carboxylesterase [Colletotrichum graminicola M1.001]